MNKLIFKVLVLSITILSLSLNLNRASAYGATKILEPNLMDSSHQTIGKKFDPEAEVLNLYLAKHNSPLQYHAQDFVDAAREYKLDWRLVASIAGVESTFGKFIPGGYNGWGWGVYGNQAIYFKSWKEGIYIVSKGLRENYINRGLTNPYSMNRAYAASPKWGSNVTYFMNDIDRFARAYESTQKVAQVNIPTIKIAAISGQLAY